MLIFLEMLKLWLSLILKLKARAPITIKARAASAPLRVNLFIS
jgi:hypothetical protein